MFGLVAHFTDGHSVELTEQYDAQFRAERAAGNYIRDYSDPCGLGTRCTHVAIIDMAMRSAA